VFNQISRVCRRKLLSIIIFKKDGIKHLISLDEDFIIPCDKEGIIFIDSTKKLKQILNQKF